VTNFLPDWIKEFEAENVTGEDQLGLDSAAQYQQ